jgi:tripartite-type tricarboxylate transporter receptor subunit TctC
MSSQLGQSVVIENRGGAAGHVAGAEVARGAADGHVVVLTTIAHNAAHSMYANIGYDPAKDLKPVVVIAEAPSVLVVHPSLPVKSVGELVALAKKRPGDLRYGSGGNGTSQHLCAEMLRAMTGIQYLHVPYKSSPQMTIDLIAGQLDLAFHQPVVVMPHVLSKRLRPLAVTADNRQAWAPDLPTVAESGIPGYEITVGSGLLAPRKTAPEIVEKLNADLQRVLNSAAIKDAYGKNYMEVTARPPKEFAAWQQRESEKMGKLVRASGAKLD